MLFKLLAAPITLPVSGFNFILDQLIGMAERELYDEDEIREELLLLQLRLEEGEIDEDTYVAEEKEILARLREARAYWRARAEAAAQDEDEGVSVSVDLPDASGEGSRPWSGA